MHSLTGLVYSKLPFQPIRSYYPAMTCLLRPLVILQAIILLFVSHAPIALAAPDSVPSTIAERQDEEIDPLPPLRLRQAASTDVAQAPLKQSISSGRSARAEQILQLTHQLLFQEIELERYYLGYRIVANREPKWRRLRYFLLQEGAGGLFLSTSIINTIETSKHFTSPNKVSPGVFRSSSRIGLIGSLMGGASSTLEMGSNGLLAMKNKAHHNDPASAAAEIVARSREIDETAKRRDALVALEKESKAYDIFVAEGRLLKTFREWCLSEFKEIYCDVKSNQSSYNAFYFMDAGAYYMSFVSYLLSIKGTRNVGFLYPALHTGLVSDSLFTVEAPASYWALSALYKYHGRQLSRKLKDPSGYTEAEARAQMLELERLAAQADEATLEEVGPIASRLAAYSYWSTRYDKYINKRIGEMRRAAKIALQSQVSGPLIGVAYLTQDTCNAIALYGSKNNPFGQDSLAFCGAATTTAAMVASVGISGWWFFDEIRNNKRGVEQRFLPEILMEDRLKTLAVLEKMLGSEKPL